MLMELDEMAEMDELREHGMDNDENPGDDPSSTGNNAQIYFIVGSGFVAQKEVNLYQVVQDVRKKMTQTMRRRKRDSRQSDQMSVGSKSHLLFVDSV